MAAWMSGTPWASRVMVTGAGEAAGADAAVKLREAGGEVAAEEERGDAKGDEDEDRERGEPFGEESETPFAARVRRCGGARPGRRRLEAAPEAGAGGGVCCGGVAREETRLCRVRVRVVV